MNDNNSDPEQDNPTDDITQEGTATPGAGKQKAETSHSDDIGNQTKRKYPIPKWFSRKFGGHCPLEWLTFAFEVLTFFALCVYSYFSYGQWRAMKDQKGVMQGQLDQMKGSSAQTDQLINETHSLASNAGKQATNTEALANAARDQVAVAKSQAEVLDRQLSVMKSGQRPWIGTTGQVGLMRTPTFEVLENSVSLNITFSVLMKNFGPATAFNVNADVVISIPLTIKDSITRPNFPDACTLLDSKTKGNVIFSGSTLVQGFDMALGTGIKPDRINEVSRIWLIGCIAYSDESKVVHYTKFWLRSTHPDDAPWIDIVPMFGKTQCRYKSIVGFESWGEEAN